MDPAWNILHVTFAVIQSCPADAGAFEGESRFSGSGGRFLCRPADETGDAQQGKVSLHPIHPNLQSLVCLSCWLALQFTSPATPYSLFVCCFLSSAIILSPPSCLRVHLWTLRCSNLCVCVHQRTDFTYGHSLHICLVRVCSLHTYNTRHLHFPLYAHTHIHTYIYEFMNTPTEHEGALLFYPHVLLLTDWLLGMMGDVPLFCPWILLHLCTLCTNFKLLSFPDLSHLQGSVNLQTTPSVWRTAWTSITASCKPTHSSIFPRRNSGKPRRTCSTKF